jgi:hypothetical protein
MRRDVTIPTQYECHLVLVGIGIRICIGFPLRPSQKWNLKILRNQLQIQIPRRRKLLIKVHTEPLLSQNGLYLTKNETQKIWGTYYKFLIFSSGIGYFEKVTILYTFRSIAFGIEESESVIGFSNFWDFPFEMGVNTNTPKPYWYCCIPLYALTLITMAQSLYLYLKPHFYTLILITMSISLPLCLKPYFDI